ncbi:J domain-containing protein [Solemya velum gill symbiont]|uniref:J domain-containing protein n=2 Tax=Solemya velum gill symbiont TaxID=2340 RepID=UPI0009970D17|nr:J domain-containing protein [Solemya velum gill symbiont]OOZ44795.1 hypothetical protein BOW37_05810 [Solemya velum gill symbiont]OOZ45789.1 hypothetical protein BOW38_08920 [Solemya velum gill symbiont]OOZ50623.1 hypothetical protein BOW39_02390 [Solemya velum gill symbiont]OOZ51868.1 hypothetical protein BOW40_05865 [Solemya velum gill symbiont]OOZ54411.1 hypothetical protein BOW41_06575 [Solemya velum gill symbiont]
MNVTVNDLYSLALDYSRKPLQNQVRIDAVDPASDSFTAFLESLKRFPDGLGFENYGNTSHNELRLAAYLLIRQRLLVNPASDYQVLGLNSDASPEQLRQRYRLMMALFHPDRHIADDSWVQACATQINNTYTRLKKGGVKNRTSTPQKANAQTSTPRKPVQKPSAKRSFEPAPDEWLYRTGLWQRHPKLLVTGVVTVIVAVFLLLTFSGPTQQVLDQQLSDNNRDALPAEEPTTESRPAIAYMLENSQQHDRVVSEILTEPARRIPAKKPALPNAKKASVEEFVVVNKPVDPQEYEIPPIAMREDPPGLLPPAPPTDASKMTSGLVLESGDNNRPDGGAPTIVPNPVGGAPSPRSNEEVAALQKQKPGRYQEQANELSSSPLPDNIDLLLARYVMAYQTGEIPQMMQLFSVNRADSNSFTEKQIRDDFKSIFSTTAERRLQIRQRHWKTLDDGQVLIRFVASSSERKPGLQEWNMKQSLVELKVKMHATYPTITAYRQGSLK